MICRVSEISESNREKYNKLKKKYICITWKIYIQYSAAIFYSKVVKSTRVCNRWSQEKRIPFINYGDMASIYYISIYFECFFPREQIFHFARVNTFDQKSEFISSRLFKQYLKKTAIYATQFLFLIHKVFTSWTNFLYISFCR